MNKIKYILVLATSALICVPAMSQRQQFGDSRKGRNEAETATSSRRKAANGGQQVTTSGKSKVQYIKNYMKQEGDSLVLDMDIDMSRLGVKTNYAQILTPVIGSEKEEIELPQVMIQGTAKNKEFARKLELDDQAYQEFENALPYAIVKPKGKLNYHIAVPYESWMENSYLDVEEDLCGCGDKSKIARTRVYDGLTKDIIAEPVYKVRPYVAYIQPEVEAIKKRQEIENAYLDFPRGKYEILPNFGNNPTELDKIDRLIRTISSNKDITVNGITMIGYASPESSLGFNTELSRNRARSLMKYFQDNTSVSSGLFDARTGGEDWDGLRRLLEDYPVSGKREIFRLMNSISDLDAREKAISKVDDGRPYKIIYDEIYPKLRRVVCEVDYTVKDFSLEEAKENLATAPQLLSLNEMYIVANTYEPGSREFLQVFETARDEFPDDPTANLNGAAAALTRGDIRSAEKYLRLADTSTPEYQNNMGVLQMLKGNYKDAERYLKRAASEGIPEASNNLRELKKKIVNVNNRREAGVDAESDNYGEELEPSRISSSKRRRAR